ncbi:MAG: FecR family protein, partial [Pedobacter sp.]
VIHDEKQPFIVKANGQLLRDIGTEFNVSNYTDENTVKATLVEGSISISNELHTKILRPGQQASVINGQSLINIQRPVMDDVLAWTNGKFTFHHQQVTDILRQAARWYDIEIIYQGPKPTTTFGGTLNRDKDVSELLENLRIIGGIKYKKTGRRIIIMN